MPLTSAMPALAAAILMPVLIRRVHDSRARALWIAGGVLFFFAAWHLLARMPAAFRLLQAISSPLFAVYLALILPALYLPHGGRAYRWFRIVPITFLVFAVLAVFDAYRSVPGRDPGFYWFLIRPGYLVGGTVSLLILIQPRLRLGTFRLAVRIACFIVLVYGGFMFRKDYTDYQDMLQRRRHETDLMLLAETAPVMQHDRRMQYLPSAPCRFTADGGYIQGCNLELFQRLLQSDWGALVRRDPAEISIMAIIMGALTMFLVMSFISARWMCGWLCPLSAIGGIIDAIRRKLGLPHIKPAQPVKVACFFSGIGIAGLTLAMAKAVPHLDEHGRFLGCKIPLYPFCKICPSQQLCPVAARGPGNYPGLPDGEWAGGFFLAACLALLALFGIGFAAGRRLWCRFCPMGMVSGLFNRGGAIRLLKDARKCNRCGVCADVCPMDIDSIRSDMIHRDVSCFDCVLCLRCIEKCPQNGCLALEHAGIRITESRFMP